MSIEPDREQYFQYATFAVVGLTVIVCLCYGLIFFNPRMNPFGALQPATATPTEGASSFQLPPTWTPIPTNTPTDTPTPVPTDTPTSTPTETPTPTNTFIPTPTRIPTRIPTSRPPVVGPPAPTATPRTSFAKIKFDAAPNCGTWYIQGSVWANGYGSGLLAGTLVRVWVNGNVYKTDTAGSHNKNNEAYWEVLFTKGSAINGLVGIVDTSGNLLSPQYPFSLTASCKGTDAVNQIIIDFSRQ